MKDVLGKDMTQVEARILRAYRQVANLVREPDLAPTSVANLKEAAAALWILVNQLGLSLERPDDLRL